MSGKGLPMPQLCRFSAAGNEGLTTRYGDRRLKSAKARSRVKLGTDSQRALWGFQVRAEFDCGEKGVDTSCLSAREGVRNIRWAV